MVCDEAAVVDGQVPDDAVAAFFGNIENDILLDSIVAVHAGIHGEKARVEASEALKHGVSFLFVVVPVGKAMVVETSSAVAEETDSKLVAITEVVPVVVFLVDEAATAFVVFVRTVVEWVDVAEAVACGTYEDTNMHTSYTHVCQGVVVTFYKHADAVRLIVARDICVGNVTVGRAVVYSILDVYADRSVLDGCLSDDSLASAVDGDAFCNASAVDDAAFQVVIAAWQ